MRFIAITSILTYTALQSAKIPQARLTHFFEEQLKKHAIPGMSVALVYKNKIIYAAGFGFADRERRKPATAHTVYNIGSISKVVTATAIMQLAEQGLIDLNAPITRYLPAFRTWKYWKRHRRITVWDLLTHYGGLPRVLPGSSHLRNRWIPDSLQVITRKTARTTRLKHSPHIRYFYSNLGFTLLGRIIENVTGQPFARYMKRTILNPLNMGTASFSNKGFRPEITALVAHGYNDGRRFNQPPIRGNPAGGLYASVLDMANFMIMNLNRGSYNNTQIVMPETLKDMFAVQNKSMPDFGRRRVPLQGIGWIIAKRKIPGAGKMVWHNGKTMGYRAIMALLLKKQLGVVILTNASGKNSKFSLQNMARRALVLALDTLTIR